MNLLLTGAAGHIGGHLRRIFAGRYPLIRLFDLNRLGDLAPHEESVAGDIADFAAVAAAMEGIDGVIHLAAQATESTFEHILSANIVGTWNVYEAARQKGVRRVVFASSNHATGFYPRARRIDDAVPQKPDSRYGLSKCFGEATGHLYADKYGVKSLHIRIGTATDLPMNERSLSTWISPRDLAQLCRIGLEHADIHSDIVYGISDNVRAWYHNANAYRLGYKPQDRAEDHVEIAMKGEAEITRDAVDRYFQGGPFCSIEYAGAPVPHEGKKA